MKTVMTPTPRPRSRARLVAAGVASVLVGSSAVAAVGLRPGTTASPPGKQHATAAGPATRRDALVTVPPAAIGGAAAEPGFSAPPDGPARRWLERARQSEADGDLDGAVAAYGRASRLLPHSPAPCMLAVRLLLRMEDPRRLRFYAACARKRAPSRPMPWAYEGIALQLLGDRDGARRAYLEFHRRAPRHPATWEALEVARRLEMDRIED